MAGMEGAGGIFSIVGNAIASEISQKAKNDQAAKELIKARQLENQANQVVAKDPVNDPAYKMKAWLAAAGIPGFEQYKQGLEETEANSAATAAKTANSGGALLNYLSALEGAKNKGMTALESKNAAYIEGKKIDLADTRYTEQEHFNELARQEKAKLNYAATAYEDNAANLHMAAQEQLAGEVGSTISNIGSMMGGGMGGGGTPSFGGGDSSGLPDMTQMSTFLHESGH